MKFSRRMVISILFIVIILLFGMFFWPFILNNIITPIALAVWLLLRIFVLSIDQKYYWGAIIFVVVSFSIPPAVSGSKSLFHPEISRMRMKP